MSDMNENYTDSIPPIPGTISADEFYDGGRDEAEADYLAEVESDRAFAEALERRAENGTWWGR